MLPNNWNTSSSDARTFFLFSENPFVKMTLSKSPFFKSHQLFSRKPLNKFAILHAPTLKEKSTEEKHTHTNIPGKSPRVKTHDTHTHTFDDTLYHFHKVYHRKFRRPWTHSWRGWHLRSLSKTFLFFFIARARSHTFHKSFMSQPIC